MDRWDKYFNPDSPTWTVCILRIIKDPITQIAAFKAGEIDFIASFQPRAREHSEGPDAEAQIMTGPETTPMVA